MRRKNGKCEKGGGRGRKRRIPLKRRKRDLYVWVVCQENMLVDHRGGIEFYARNQIKVTARRQFDFKNRLRRAAIAISI